MAEKQTSSLEDQLAALKEQNKSLERKLRKATNRPPKSVSLTEMSDGERKGPVYDPAQDVNRLKEERDLLAKNAEKARKKYAEAGTK